MNDRKNFISGFDLPGAAADGEVQSYSLEALTEETALILNVYAHDFSPVCTDQLCAAHEMEWMTFRDDVTVVGLSGDGPYSHRQYARQNDISYPLLSDTDLSICDRLDVLTTGDVGSAPIPQRSVFLIDPTQQIRYAWTAADNWAPWDNDPLYEIRSRLDESGAT